MEDDPVVSQARPKRQAAKNCKSMFEQLANAYLTTPRQEEAQEKKRRNSRTRGAAGNFSNVEPPEYFPVHLADMMDQAVSDEDTKSDEEVKGVYKRERRSRQKEEPVEVRVHETRKRRRRSVAPVKEAITPQVLFFTVVFLCY